MRSFYAATIFISPHRTGRRRAVHLRAESALWQWSLDEGAQSKRSGSQHQRGADSSVPKKSNVAYLTNDRMGVG
jgi:hypothetical protein